MVDEEKKVVEPTDAEAPMGDVMEKPATVAEQELPQETAQAAEEETAQETVQETAQDDGAPTQEVPQKEPMPQTDKKKGKITDFTARLLADEKYTMEEAIALAREKLQSYRYLDDGFLKATESKDAFAYTKSYAVAYRCKATAQYVWKTGAKQDEQAHETKKDIAVLLTSAPAYLRMESIGEGAYTKLEQEKSDDVLYPSKKQLLKDCVKSLREKAEAATPYRRAKIELSNECYEMVYVPIVTLACTYQGVRYCIEVNLVNGACHVCNYLVAETALKAAEKAMERVAKAKRSIVFSFFYALTFAVLAFLSWYVRFAGVQAGNEGVQALLMAIILGGVSVVVLVLRFLCNTYQKQKMVDAAVNKGVLPKTKGATFCGILAVLAAMVNVVLFAAFVLL